MDWFEYIVEGLDGDWQISGSVWNSQRRSLLCKGRQYAESPSVRNGKVDTVWETEDEMISIGKSHEVTDKGYLDI